MIILFSNRSCSMELLTGKLPYQELPHRTFDRHVVKFVLQGRKPRRPHDCAMITDEIWALLERCWDSDPRQRPTSDDVLCDLKTIQQDLRAARQRAQQTPPILEANGNTTEYHSVTATQANPPIAPRSPRGGVEMKTKHAPQGGKENATGRPPNDSPRQSTFAAKKQTKPTVDALSSHTSPNVAAAASTPPKQLKTQTPTRLPTAEPPWEKPLQATLSERSKQSSPPYLSSATRTPIVNSAERISQPIRDSAVAKRTQRE